MASNNVSGDCLEQEKVDYLYNITLAMGSAYKDEAEKIRDKACVIGWVSRVSIGNKNAHEKSLTAQRWLNFVVVLALIFYFQIMRKNQRKIDKDCDESNTTPSDYTIMVSNIKTKMDIDYDDELKMFFEENAIPGKTASIGKFYWSFSIY